MPEATAAAVPAPEAPAGAAVPATAPKRKGVPPGIYFGMTNEAYHADSALGSTNLRKLANNPADYWYESTYNPLREPETVTPAKRRGQAMHALTLEGLKAFEKQYICGARHADGMTPSEKGAATKAANAKAAALGKEALPSDDYDRVMIAGAMITKNPKLASAFEGGAPEVSVFWERDGVMFKIRIDYLKPRGIGDLKSITNIHSKAFADACHDAIANYRYDVQAAHYLDGRAQMPQLIADGLMFAAATAASAQPAAHQELLKGVAAAKSFGFQWVFFAAEGAPLTYSKIMSPANPMVAYAREEIQTAVRNYKAFMDKFGLDQIWLEDVEPTELNMDEMPPWWGRTRRK